MNYKFKNIFPFVDFEVDKTYLVLFNVDKIPPHLGIIKNKKYYSITIKETEIGLNEKAIINLIARKKIPTIIIAINDRLNNIEAYYSKYSNRVKESISCLKPIKEYFAEQNEFKSD